MHSADHAILVNEVRYAERLCQRTARLYRRLQAAGTAAAVLGGSAALAAASPLLPAWVTPVGILLAAGFGALLLAIRPADKAAANEADARRYARLRTEARQLDAQALRIALDKARESDTAEVEPLRAVAYNDVVHEIGARDAAVPLRWHQKVLALMA